MNDPIAGLIFLVHLGSTLYLVGLIWFVQIVHYPLFDGVAAAEFQSYEKRHSSLTTWVVGPPMLVELATGVLLLGFPPAGAPSVQLWAGLALVGLIWISTALVQVPCHNVLMTGFDAAVHRRLVVTNWIRTVAWSVRGLLVLYMAAQMMN